MIFTPASRWAPNADSAEWLSGFIPDLPTPFDLHDEIDADTFGRLCERQIAAGATALVVGETAGESSTLEPAERAQLVSIAARVARKRVRIIAGAGSNSTREGIGLVRHAAEVGADAALVVTPYYNKPTQAGLIAHFTALAEASDLPIIIYNIPGRSVVDMTPETMGELAKLPTIIGVKDATGKLERVSQQRMTCGTDFVQLSGEDGTALGFNAHGGVGCISVTANVAPKLCAEFQEATLAGDYAKALEYQDRLMPLHIAIFIEPGLVGAKYALSKLGRCTDAVRLPLVLTVPVWPRFWMPTATTPHT